jgi:hypothetical protein
MALTLLGGVITTFTSGAVNYKSHTFTGSTDQLTISGTGTQAVQLLVVGGGGGGSRGGGGQSIVTDHGNGGGGGGVFFTSSYTFDTTYPTWSVSIGAGGIGGTRTTGATNGGVTSFTGPGVTAKTIFSSSFGDGAFFQLTGSVTGAFFITSSTTQVDTAVSYYIVTGSTAAATISNIVAKINTLTATFGITANVLNSTSASLSASAAGTAGNSFSYKSGSSSQTFTGGINTTAFTGSYGGFGGQPQGGNGASGGGSFPSGAAAIFADSGSAGGAQQGKSGAGGGGAASAGSNATSVYNSPFTIYNGGAGGNGKSLSLEDGTTKHYGAGGGGGGWVNVGPGSGGAGGNSGVGGRGGSGVQGAGGNGVANTGAGGGGGALSDQSSNWGAGGSGASGVVVITYTV